MHLLSISKIPRLKNPDCDTSLKAKRYNRRKLHDIDDNFTSTHFLRKNIFHAWDTCEDILEKGNYAPVD